MKEKTCDYNKQIPLGLTVSFSSQLKKTCCYILGIPWDSMKNLFSYGERFQIKHEEKQGPAIPLPQPLLLPHVLLLVLSALRELV